MLSMALPALSAPPPKSLYNPRPEAGDLVLPMPADAELVLRPAVVPGKGFWGAQERVVQLGDSSGGAFEGVQRTMVNGSFPDPQADQWLIWLAKYELTKGQYVAVMGADALAAASGNPADRDYATLEGRELEQASVMPLTWVSHQAVEDFLRAYNRWLFDPAHPQRRAALPTVDGVPGFLRLATEEEWEYVARGGLPAIDDGSFDKRLPFSKRQLNKYAWHLGNAKNRLRPIGLRQANGLGIHDLFGNAHEMTAGLFRPEIRQGKPGGVPVRGASVSSPLKDLRSSYRTELDAYAWDGEKQQMSQRRAFNIGARLALGSNVVVSSEARSRLEQAYHEYRKNLRPVTPVGRSLDNLVSQASSQLATVDGVLERMLQRYPDAQDQVAAIQAYVDGARERLDQAQRESARSLLQDASRNGTNLSVLISKRPRLEGALKSAEKLLEMSTRYQQQVEKVRHSLDENLAAATEQYAAYLKKVAELGDHQAAYREYAFKTMAGEKITTRETRVLEFLAQHVGHYNETREVKTEEWRTAFDTVFSQFDE
jgi:formylglycine-generating enzyme required for sulfatase activity